MNTLDPRYQSPAELAGTAYEEMILSKPGAIKYLTSEDPRLRLAAMLICESVWTCQDDSTFVDACRRLAGAGTPDGFRACAVSVIGRTLSGSKAAEESRLLGEMVFDGSLPDGLRLDAYWALRQIQFGLADTSFDNFMKGVICTIEPILNAFPEKFSKEAVRSALLPANGFEHSFWDLAFEIDWDFVRRFAIGEEKGTF